MQRIVVAEVPRLKTYAPLLVKAMASLRPDTVLLPLPRGLEKEAVEEALSGRDPSGVISERTGLPSLIFSYATHILFLLVRESRLEAELLFYRSLENLYEDFRASVEAVSLLAITLTTGRVPVERWLRLLSLAKSVSGDYAFVANRARGLTLLVCSWGSNAHRYLKQLGLEVSVLRVAPYVPLPLEALLAMEKPSPEDVERLVREHAKFVSEYLVVSRDLDEAYLKWLERERPRDYARLMRVLALPASRDVQLRGEKRY